MFQLCIKTIIRLNITKVQRYRSNTKYVLYCIVFIVRSLDLYKAKSPLDIELVNTVTHSLMLLKMGGINARNMLS